MRARVRFMRTVEGGVGGGGGQRRRAGGPKARPRPGAGMPKQRLRLAGRTLIEHCVAAFEQAPGVDEILVVMAGGYLEQVSAVLAGYRKVSAVIEGGVTRPDSTRVALAAIARTHPGEVGVLLHD